MHPSQHERAFLLTEMIVALAVLGILMSGMAVTLYGVRQFDRTLWVRQRCAAAAQAQLDSYMVTGRPIAEDQLAELWPRLKVAAEVRPGQGQWQGLDRVEVTASGPSGRRTVKVTLSRYGTVPKQASVQER